MNHYTMVAHILAGITLITSLAGSTSQISKNTHARSSTGPRSADKPSIPDASEQFFQKASAIHSLLGERFGNHSVRQGNRVEDRDNGG